MSTLFGPLALALVVLVPGAPALAADPGYYVVSAYSNEGLRTIDARYWTVKFPNSPTIKWPEVGVGYGVTARWHTELFASYVGTSQSATRLSTLNWQNDYLLTQGDYPFDLAMHATLTHSYADGVGNTLEYGPVLQTDIGRTQFNANVFFERSFGAADSSPTELRYQWQVRYRWTPLLNVGLQGFGELGPWDHWAPHDQQSHRAGPALFGTLPLDDRQALAYQAAYLVGSIYGHHGNMFSMQVQYAF